MRRGPAVAQWASAATNAARVERRAPLSFKLQTPPARILLMVARPFFFQEMNHVRVSLLRFKVQSSTSPKL